MPLPASIDTPQADTPARITLALSELPYGPLRARVEALLLAAVQFAAHPTCAEAQADGVPCPTAQNSCDRCHRVMTALDAARAQLQA